MKINAFKTDLEKERFGTWVNGPEGLQLLVARSGNSRFLAEMRTLGKGKLTAAKIGAMSEEEALDIYVKAMSRTILLGWKNLQDESGDVPYSVEKAEEYLKIRDFRELVEEVSKDAERFREGVTSEILGN